MKGFFVLRAVVLKLFGSLRSSVNARGGRGMPATHAIMPAHIALWQVIINCLPPSWVHMNQQFRSIQHHSCTHATWWRGGAAGSIAKWPIQRERTGGGCLGSWRWAPCWALRWVPALETTGAALKAFCMQYPNNLNILYYSNVSRDRKAWLPSCLSSRFMNEWIFDLGIFMVTFWATFNDPNFSVNCELRSLTGILKTSYHSPNLWAIFTSYKNNWLGEFLLRPWGN